MPHQGILPDIRGAYHPVSSHHVKNTNLTDIGTEKTIQNCVTKRTRSTGNHKSFTCKILIVVYISY